MTDTTKYLHEHIQFCGGTGDYTKEKQEYPEPNFDEYAAELLKLDAELAAQGG